MTRLPRLSDLPADALEPMPLKGVAHDHVRLRGRRLVARIPRWSQLGLAPWTALERQAAAFQRAEPSGHTPRFAGLLPPGDGLPLGALLVGEVEGRAPRLPDDMPAIARALAALHRMAPPDFYEPLPAPPDPVAALLAQVERQAEWFDHAVLTADARALIAAELDAARAGDLNPPPDTPMPLTAVGVDVHPGNFLIDGHGKAWFTDLEKLQYGHPASDLAHASLYTSTKWDPAVNAVLAPADVATFLDAWALAVPGDLAGEVQPWLRPLRRLTWLRTLSWMARWAVEGAALSPGMPEPLRAHMDAHAADILRAERIGQVRRDWA
ncbi:aminoglycoside phosphotransferase [Azospirillum sp. TSO35-2]|nr:aminoglycoside phosphotransferase [Azospirillum sp. TSO35-2]